MRVEFAFHPRVEQQVRVQLLGDRHRRLAFAETLQNTGQLCFKQQAVVKNEICLLEPSDIPLAGTEEVGVHTRPHQDIQFDLVTRHLPDRIADQPGGGNHPQFSGLCLSIPLATSQQQQSQQRAPDPAPPPSTFFAHIAPYIILKKYYF
jgi:hypothetical protein